MCADELPATLSGEGTFPGRAAGPSPHSLQQRDNLKRTLLFALRTALLPATVSYGLQGDGIIFWKAFRAGLSRASPSGTLVGSFVHLSAACRRCMPTEFGGLPPSAFLLQPAAAGGATQSLTTFEGCLAARDSHMCSMQWQGGISDLGQSDPARTSHVSCRHREVPGILLCNLQQQECKPVVRRLAAQPATVQGDAVAQVTADKQ